MALSHHEVIEILRSTEINDAVVTSVLAHKESCPTCLDDDKALDSAIDRALHEDEEATASRIASLESQPQDASEGRSFAYAATRDIEVLVSDSTGSPRWVMSECGNIEFSVRLGAASHEADLYLKGDPALIDAAELKVRRANSTLGDCPPYIRYGNAATPTYRIPLDLRLLRLERANLIDLWFVCQAFKLRVARLAEDSSKFEMLRRHLQVIVRAASVRPLWQRLFAEEEEAVQELSVHLLRWEANWSEQGKIEAWLTRCVKRKLLDLLPSGIKGGATHPEPLTGNEAAGSSHAPDERLECRSVMEALTRALAQLSEQQRYVFELRHYGDVQDYKAIARIVLKSAEPTDTEAARMRNLHRLAVAKLSVLLKRAGIGPSL